MQDKKYVMVNGPVRETIGTMMFGGLIAHPYNYRTGDLGLIHPSIVSFWKNFHKNYFKRGKGLACFSSDNSSGIEIYIHEKDDVPILLYNGHLLSCGSPPHLQKRRGYLIAPLKENEFTEIQGNSLGEVRNELRKFYNEGGMKVFCHPANMAPEEALEKAIREQWKKLALFNPNKNLIYEIPIESSRRHIPKEEIERQEQLTKDLNALAQWRRESMRSDFIIGAHM